MSETPDNSEADFKILIHHVATTQANKVEEKKEVEKAWHGMWVCFALSGFVFFAIYVPYLFRSHETSPKSSAAESYSQLHGRLEFLSQRLAELEDPVKDFNKKLQHIKRLLEKENISDNQNLGGLKQAIEAIKSLGNLGELGVRQQQINNVISTHLDILIASKEMPPHFRRAVNLLVDLSAYDYEINVATFSREFLKKISEDKTFTHWCRPQANLATFGGGTGNGDPLAFYKIERSNLIVYCWNNRHGPIGFRIKFDNEQKANDFVNTWNSVELDTSAIGTKTPPRLRVLLIGSSEVLYQINEALVDYQEYDAVMVGENP
ncbi:MAG: hypothetical protein JNK90_17155 [Planctomycetaceae bacterium]|nr:hypothetical protein [Planctomycetaceae bacterium]